MFNFTSAATISQLLEVSLLLKGIKGKKGMKEWKEGGKGSRYCVK
jgi:hypothetical protein